MSKPQQHIEQLLIDDSFLRWIKGEADENERRKWDQWLRQDPARTYYVKEARYLYRSLKFEEELPHTLSELNRLRNTLNSNNVKELEYRRPPEFYGRRNRRGSYWASIAVICLLLISVVIVVQTVEWDTSKTGNNKSNKPVYSTAVTEYGQIRRLTLWDGSEVVLSANSKLNYPKHYNGGSLNVKLEGEAFFSITHKKEEENRGFTVQTTEGKIRVLGTKFNVNTRSDVTEVVLEEGKVYLGVSDSLSAVKSNYSYTMKPGERASLSPQREGINVQTTDPALFTSWRNLEFKFHNTPLVEIAERIEQYYGVKVEFKDENLKRIEFSGSVTNKNYAVLLHGLRTMLDIPITDEKDTIFFGK